MNELMKLSKKQSKAAKLNYQLGNVDQEARSRNHRSTLEDKKQGGACGVDGGWQLDHIKSVKECFSEGWTVEQASDASNLRMLTWQENLMRNYESSL